MPPVKGLGGGDYIRLRVCLLCRGVLDLDVDEVLRLQDMAVRLESEGE